MLYEKIELEEGEVVLDTVRKHWFIITIELFGFVVTLLAPLVLLFGTTLLPSTLDITTLISDNSPLITFSICIWLLFNFMLAFTVWTHYYLDLWVITDRRIIIIDQIHFFNRKVSSFRLERLQDIKVEIKGIIPTLLNFGTIRAQTASPTESDFAATGMPDPRHIQATIQRATDARLKALNGNIVV